MWPATDADNTPVWCAIPCQPPDSGSREDRPGSKSEGLRGCPHPVWPCRACHDNGPRLKGTTRAAFPRRAGPPATAAAGEDGQGTRLCTGRVGVSLPGGLCNREGSPADNASPNAVLPRVSGAFYPPQGDPGPAPPAAHQVFATVDGAAPDTHGPSHAAGPAAPRTDKGGAGGCRCVWATRTSWKLLNNSPSFFYPENTGAQDNMSYQP